MKRRKLTTWTVLGLGAGASVLISATNGFATTYFVKPTGGTVGGTSWGTAFNNPQLALNAAGADLQTQDEIWVAAGTYYPITEIPPGGDPRRKAFQLVPNCRMYGGFVGTETALNQRRPGAQFNCTTLSGEIGNPSIRTDNCYHVVYAYSGDFAVTITETTQIDGFEITHGYADGPGGPGIAGSFGGGILVRQARPVIQNCAIVDNDALVGGGGAHTEGAFDFFIAYANPQYISCAFLNNRSQGAAGGLCNRYHESTAINCVFSANSATNIGGGIRNGSDNGNPPDVRKVTAIGCTFSNNTAHDGGGIYNGGHLFVRNSILWGDSVTGGNGPEILSTGGVATDDVTYTDVQMPPLQVWPGAGNVNTDPSFIAPPRQSALALRLAGAQHWRPDALPIRHLRR